MKHARQDYDRIQDPSKKIPENEPVFLLRAQDKLSAETLRFYAQKTRDHGGSEEIVQLVLAHAKKMDKWPVKKLADLAPPEKVEPKQMDED